jgi:hypothetical protein
VAPRLGAERADAAWAIAMAAEERSAADLAAAFAPGQPAPAADRAAAL